MVPGHGPATKSTPPEKRRFDGRAHATVDFLGCRLAASDDELDLGALRAHCARARALADDAADAS
jgi:hypothetical protein